MTILRKKHLPQPHIKLQGETIQYVDSFKLLGITISSDLSWKPHITAVASKAKKFLGFLYHVFRVSSRNCPSRLYEVVVLPHLDYCSSVWDPSTKFTSNCWRTCRCSQPRLPQIVDHMILVSWRKTSLAQALQSLAIPEDLLVSQDPVRLISYPSNNLQVSPETNNSPLQHIGSLPSDNAAFKHCLKNHDLK